MVELIEPHPPIENESDATLGPLLTRVLYFGI